jgi:hypothetical protein
MNSSFVEVDPKLGELPGHVASIPEKNVIEELRAGVAPV